MTKERLAQIQQTLPRDVRPRVIADQSVFIVAAINSIKHHLILGGLFASFVIFIFLRRTGAPR